MSSPEHARDSELLQLAQAGDGSAFEGLLERHRDRVFSLAVRIVGVEADAAEIAQDAFLAAYRNLSNFRGDAAFGSWVYRIAANFALMKLRQRRVTAEVEAPLEEPQFSERGTLIDAVADWGRNAEALTLDAELRAAIGAATDALPEPYRTAFLLRDLDGLSYEEISEVTGDSVAAIKSRLHRARLAIRAAIDRFYSERNP